MILAFRVAMATALAMPIAVAAQPASRFADTKAVEAVLSQYKAAIEKLDAKGTERLFAADSQIFETGGSEGTYATYLAHHLGPELAAFKSFTFSDYKVKVRLRVRSHLPPRPTAIGSSRRTGLLPNVLASQPAS